MAELALFIRSKAQPGKRDEIQALYTEILAPRAEENDAQPVVVWAADQHDPDAFYLLTTASSARRSTRTSTRRGEDRYRFDAGRIVHLEVRFVDDGP